MGFFDKLFGKKENKPWTKVCKKPRKVFYPDRKSHCRKKTVDEEVLDNLEEALVSADVGVDTTIQIIERIEKRVARG